MKETLSKEEIIELLVLTSWCLGHTSKLPDGDELQEQLGNILDVLGFDDK